MKEIQPSPRISDISWGRMVVEGVGKGKDFVLFPGGGHPWDWGETGMRHSPGIRPIDVEEVLEKGSTVIVLSQGMALRLETSPDTIEFLERRGIPVYVKPTKEAAELYNELAATQAVGGLFHSTC